MNTERSFLGVVFRGQSLETRITGVLTHAGAGGGVRRVPLTGKAHGSCTGAGGQRPLGSPSASRGRCGGRRKQPAPSQVSELRFRPLQEVGRVSKQGSALTMTCPLRAKAAHVTLGPSPSPSPQVPSATGHCRGTSLGRLNRILGFNHGLLRTYYVLSTS